jgi:hypothetical protein
MTRQAAKDQVVALISVRWAGGLVVDSIVWLATSIPSRASCERRPASSPPSSRR